MDNKIKFPLYLPGTECEINEGVQMIVADLRKDESTLAVFLSINKALNLLIEKKYATADFPSVSEMIKLFISENNLTNISKISVAVPGPVILDRCETLNLPWVVSAEEIKSNFNFEKVCLINDLRATAYSLVNIENGCLEVLHDSENKSQGNVAILAPGNGLGEAGLFFDEEFLRPFATEGGHTEFSPRNDYEVDFYQFLNKIYGIVSWENVLTKKGIYNIYRFLRDIGRHEEAPWLNEKIQNEGFIEAVVSVAKEKKSRLATLTLEYFLEYLARESNNLVLKLKATGGLIITGEIIDQIYDLIDKEKFYKNFLISDHMEQLLKDTPIYILRNKKEILEGAAYYGMFWDQKK